MRHLFPLGGAIMDNDTIYVVHAEPADVDRSQVLVDKLNNIPIEKGKDVRKYYNYLVIKEHQLHFVLN